MKIERSITTKLLITVLLSLILSMMTLFFISDHVLKQILDESQNAIFQEKIGVIIRELRRRDALLQNTGIPEAYKYDFQQQVLAKIGDIYFDDEHDAVYPFIMDLDLNIIIHSNPNFPPLSEEEKEEAYPYIQTHENSFDLLFRGEQRWYIYEAFEPWGWLVSFSIPLDEKYNDLISYRRTFLFLLFILSGITAAILTLFMVSYTRPIHFLTEMAQNLANGDLEQNLDLIQNDEIGSLAESFREMQAAVKQKIGDLNLEIRERERVEKELSQARNLIAGIIESMPSVLVALDNKGCVTQWNGRAEKRSGIPFSEALGQPLRELIPWVSEEMPKAWAALEKGEAKYTIQKEWITEEGLFYDDIIIYPLTVKGQEGVVIRIDDITEKILFDKKLAESRKMEAIGQLAGGVAHDFNNMLSGIIGAAALIEMTSAMNDKEAMKYIKMIQKASGRASDLTGKLLSFGRRQAIPSSSFHLHEAAEAGLSLLERTIDRNVKIRFEPEAEMDTLTGSFTSVQNAIMNLVINSSHAMPGGGEVVIRTMNLNLNEEECHSFSFELTPGAYIRIDIEDNGTGIEPDLLDKIFEPFFTTKKNGDGTGLGLASVYGMIQNHRGAVTLESTPGEGTAFHLFFPCSQDKITRKAVVLQNKERGNETVLLVDDESIVRISMRDYLMKKGYTVIEASNGSDALDIYRENSAEIDLVLTDMVMSGLSGRDVFYGVRKIDKTCPVIIASGFIQDDNLEKMQNDGLSGFIAKPFGFSDLCKSIRNTLDKAATR
jgi:PAS domain S-box-containing protein